MRTEVPSPKVTQPPISGPYLLWPTARWIKMPLVGGRHRPKRHRVRWGPSSPPPKGGTAPIFGPGLLWPNGYMDQDATWYGGRPQPRPHCARWGPSPLPQKRGTAPPNFWLMSIVANRSPISATAECLLSSLLVAGCMCQYCS